MFQNGLGLTIKTANSRIISPPEYKLMESFHGLVFGGLIIGMSAFCLITRSYGNLVTQMSAFCLITRS